MTVSNTTAVFQFNGDDVTTDFVFGNVLFEDTSIRVIYTDLLGDNNTLILNTDYTVAILGDFSQATVTITSFVPETGTTITIQRDEPFTQLTDYIEGGPFPAESHERALDRATLQNQTQEVELGLTITLPANTPPAVNSETGLPVANGLWQWDGLGENIQFVDPSAVPIDLGDLTLTGDIFLENDQALFIKDFGGTYREIVTVNPSDQTILGATTLAALLQGTNIQVTGTGTMGLATTGNTSLTTSAGTLNLSGSGNVDLTSTAGDMDLTSNSTITQTAGATVAELDADGLDINQALSAVNLYVDQAAVATDGQLDDLAVGKVGHARFTSANAKTVTGIVPTTFARNQLLILTNQGAGPLTIATEDVGSTAANRFQLDAPVTLTENQGLSFIYDTTVSRWLPAAGSGSGSGGQAGKNYIANGQAEVDLTGWTVTGGDITFTRNETNPLRDTADFKMVVAAANALDQTVHYDFSVDIADLSAALTIDGVYATAASYVTGQIKLEIIADPTGTPVTILSADVTQGAAFKIIEYYSNTGETDYRFQYRVATTDAVSRQLNFDDLRVSPNSGLIAGPVRTDFVSTGTIGTIGGTGSAPTKGTTAIDEVLAARDGQEGIFWYRYEQTGAGTDGTGNYIFPLPPGYSFGPDVLPTTTGNFKDAAGHALPGMVALGQSNNWGPGFIVPYDATSFRVQAISGEAGTTFTRSDYIGAGFGNLGSSARAFAFRFQAPMLGWSASGNVVPAAGQYDWFERFAGSAVRVTGADPTVLGEYRSLIKPINSTANSVDTDGSAEVSSANGGKVFAKNYATAGTAGEPQAWFFYVGRNKVINWNFWTNAGRGGLAQVDVYVDSPANQQYGLGYGYDEDAGMVWVDCFLNGTAISTRHCGRGKLTSTGATTSQTDVFFSFAVADEANALGLQVDNEGLAQATAGWVHLKTLDAAGDTWLEFNDSTHFDGTYRTYAVVGATLRASNDNVGTRAQVHEGSAWKEGASDYRMARFTVKSDSTTQTVASSGATTMVFVNGVGNASGESCAFTLFFDTGGDGRPSIHGTSVIRGPSNLCEAGHYGGWLNTGVTANGIRIGFVSGTVLTGKIALYGIRTV